MSDPHAPPMPPEKPLPGDCCGGGCVVCVHDAYEEALADYERRLALWRATLPQAPSRQDPAAGPPPG